MCKWKPKVLADPHEYTNLVAPMNLNQGEDAPGAEQMTTSQVQSDNKLPIYAHCMDFTEGE